PPCDRRKMSPGTSTTQGRRPRPGALARHRAAAISLKCPGGAMPALPPDPPRGLPPAPGGPAAGEPGGTGTADARCPHPPTRPRSPAGPRPLPDPEAVRLCLIPDSAPPYDAEV